MKIFIPTKSRVDDQRTLKFMPEDLRKQCILVVDEAEADDYRKVHDNLLVVPSELKGISAVRKYIWDTSDDPRICMLDDDLRFHIRSGEGTKLRNAEPEEYYGIFEEIERLMDMGYGHVGISDRNGNNRAEGKTIEELVGENQRYIRVLAYDLELCKGKAEHGRVKVMEDFDITLTLLKMGYPNRVSYKYCWGQRKSGDEGGCSTYRTFEMQREAAFQLSKLHPGLVKVKAKRSKETWGGIERKYRTDVIIYWKKAYKEKAKKKDLGWLYGK